MCVVHLYVCVCVCALLGGVRAARAAPLPVAVNATAT